MLIIRKKYIIELIMVELCYRMEVLVVVVARNLSWVNYRVLTNLERNTYECFLTLSPINFVVRSVRRNCYNQRWVKIIMGVVRKFCHIKYKKVYKEIYEKNYKNRKNNKSIKKWQKNLTLFMNNPLKSTLSRSSKLRDKKSHNFIIIVWYCFKLEWEERRWQIKND